VTDAPDVSVVLATHDRPQRLARQLAALRAQTLDLARYEIIVVDDASQPETVDLLARESARAGGPGMTVIRRDVSGGPARARNAGWQAARGALIAFTDDDCEATPRWLEAGLEAFRAHPESFIQGPTAPLPSEAASFGPFSHTVRNASLGPGYETANIFYPRAVLERLGGFDEDAYSGPGGEDTDLAWKAIGDGVQPVWAQDALMHHCVVDLGMRGKLRLAWRWHESMLPFKRYPALRKHRYGGIFWSTVHWWLFRAVLALIVPRRQWFLRWWLAAPYVVHLTNRRTGPLLAPFLIVHDLVETAACVRGAIRYRVLIA
jgi:glycosyltransferase involved in cell wall biosynthesis